MTPEGYFRLDFKDWAVVISTVLGPILAVQAQKAVESFREKRRRKTQLFEQLMATRASRVSPEHVRALNMIDLVFYGARTLGVNRRTTAEQRVLDSWKEYLDHLNNRAAEESVGQWGAKGAELFTNLLFAIAGDIGFKFDRVQLKRGSYSPVAHSQLEEEEAEIRGAALSLLTGKHALNMNVVSLPLDADALESNKATTESFRRALETGALRVEVSRRSAPEP